MYISENTGYNGYSNYETWQFIDWIKGNRYYIKSLKSAIQADNPEKILMEDILSANPLRYELSYYAKVLNNSLKKVNPSEVITYLNNR